jgi:hypothetical protein
MLVFRQALDLAAMVGIGMVVGGVVVRISDPWDYFFSRGLEHTKPNRERLLQVRRQ